MRRSTQWSLGDTALTVLATITLLAMLVALYTALVTSPAERVEGDAFRIFYFHLPLAMLTYVAFFVVFVASLAQLWRSGLQWDRVARCSAEIGFIFCTLVLVTGSIWGRSIWGVWWAWDARLTSTLVLWFMYLAYLMVHAYVDDRDRAARYAAVLGIVGFLDVPVVQFSVNWWRTLHPQSTVLASAGQSLPLPMLIALIAASIAVCLLYALLFVLRLRIESARDVTRDLGILMDELRERAERTV